MRRTGLTAFALLLALSACSQRSSQRGTELPLGDAVWFLDGAGSAPAETEATLARTGFASVFLPVNRLSFDQGRWGAMQLPPPPTPFARLPVFLVVGCEPSAAGALRSAQRVAGMRDAAWLAVKAALREGSRYGRVAGVLLDFPFEPSTAPAYAELVAAVRSKMPRKLPLAVSMKFRLEDAEREKLVPLAAAADGFLALVFGEENAASPAATDQLGKPWWAGYAPAAAGHASGSADSEPLPESVLAKMTDDPRIEFSQDVLLKEEAGSTFILRPREEVSIDGRRWPAGTRITFRQPSTPDLIYRLGSDLAGRRFVRGRVVVLSGANDGNRIFTLAALNAILAGGSLNPQLRVSTEAGRGFIAIGAENVSPQATVVSRTTNWVEVDVPNAGIVDVQSGGFDRYEVFGPDGGPAALGRATRVRFYETLVGPYEKIAPARVVLRRPPSDCCTTRIHLLAAAGNEITGDGRAATPPAGR
jgi:hypothetical protein